MDDTLNRAISALTEVSPRVRSSVDTEAWVFNLEQDDVNLNTILANLFESLRKDLEDIGVFFATPVGDVYNDTILLEEVIKVLRYILPTGLMIKVSEHPKQFLAELTHLTDGSGCYTLDQILPTFLEWVSMHFEKLSEEAIHVFSVSNTFIDYIKGILLQSKSRGPSSQISKGLLEILKNLREKIWHLNADERMWYLKELRELSSLFADPHYSDKCDLVYCSNRVMPHTKASAFFEQIKESVDASNPFCEVYWKHREVLNPDEKKVKTLASMFKEVLQK